MKSLFQRMPTRLWLLIVTGQLVVFVFLVSFSVYYLPGGQGSGVVYLVGSILILLLSVLLQVLIAYRTIIPRIRRFNEVFDQVNTGDFSARIELGKYSHISDPVFGQINRLMETIEGYIFKLHALTDSVEALSNALNKEEVRRVVAEIIEKQLGVSCVGMYRMDEFETDRAADVYGARQLSVSDVADLMSGKVVFVSEDKAQEVVAKVENEIGSLMFVPVVEDVQVSDIIVFSGTSTNLEFDPVTREFARTLSRFMASAFGRIKSLQEITEAERKYRDLFMRADSGILRTNGRGSLQEVNPALASMGGYESVEEMLEQVGKVSDLFDDIKEYQRLMQSLNFQNLVKDIHINLLRKDGSPINVSLSAHTIKDNHGELIAVEGFVVDLTERMLREDSDRKRLSAEAEIRVKSAMLKELEMKNLQLNESLAEIRLMQRQLLQSEKSAALGAMAGSVAGDLNNFLAGAVSYPEILSAQLPKDSELLQPLEALKKSGEQAMALVSDLLSLSGRPEEAWEADQLNPLIDQALNSLPVKRFQTLHPESRVEVKLCDEPTPIKCLPIHLKKTLIELILNSMKAAGVSGVVEITTAHKEIDARQADDMGLQAGQHLLLCLTDHGPIMSETDRQHIFEPFYFRNVYGVDSERSGLELAMSLNIVREHDGTICIDSGEDWTSYVIYLPTAATRAGMQLDDRQPSADELRGSGSILVVDDEPLQRDIAGQMLMELGYQAYFAPSGEAALKFLGTRSVDLVLLDMLMAPGMNGLETFEKILQIHPDQKALIVSGYSQSSDIVKTMELGAGGLLKKPYSFGQFGRAVQSLLKNTN